MDDNSILLLGRYIVPLPEKERHSHPRVNLKVSGRIWVHMGILN